ncbi:MAG: YfhO family protein [Chitinophagales bacterium]|nr:YfhO family protein [Chitinophagales bacterium]
MKPDSKALAPYLLPIIVIILANIIYFLPQFQGKVVKQGDIIQHIGMSKEATDYRAKTGEEALWTNSMFGGMPTYQISARQQNNLLQYVEKTGQLFIPRPAGYFIFGMLGFYLLLLLLGVNPWLSLLGSLLFGFSTNNFILFEAGHNSKVMAIMTSAPVIAGVLLIFKEKYLLGAGVFGIALGLNIAANHPQMTFYLAICLGILVLIHLVNSIKEKKIASFAKGMAIMAGLAILSLGASASKLWTTYEYTKYTMRGGQIIENDAQSTTQTDKKGGLEWDYAMQWSNGFGDVLAAYIPKVVGGGSGEWLDGSSTLGKAVGQRQPFQFGTYFGSLPFTSGPVYYGVIAFLLFVLGLFVVKGEIKWWILSVVLITTLISLGKNFAGFNKFFFDYFPMMNKFRAPSSILSITAIFIPILGVLGLSEIIKNKDKSPYVKPLFISSGILAGIAAVIWLAGPSLFNLSTPMDDQYPQIKDAVLEQRASMMTSSAFRSLFFILLAAGMIYAFIKEKLSTTVLVASLTILGLFDLFQVGKDYLDKKDFVSKTTYKSEFQPRDVDTQILQDKDPNFRVLDATINTFNSASSSYFHKTIGGYSAVKMQRYQDLIDHQISQNNMAVFNMLNTKYFIGKGADNNPNVQRNPAALGNAWFVNTIIPVNSAREEMEAMNDFDPAGDVIVHKEFSDYVNGLQLTKSGSIVLKSYSPNKLEYESDTNGDQFAVFSEIYYGPNTGWQAYVDGNPVDHIRVDYLLRGMKVPSGKHSIVFEFKPSSYYVGEQISLASSGLLLALMAFVIFKTISRKEEQTLPS